MKVTIELKDKAIDENAIDKFAKEYMMDAYGADINAPSQCSPSTIHKYESYKRGFMDGIEHLVNLSSVGNKCSDSDGKKIYKLCARKHITGGNGGDGPWDVYPSYDCEIEEKMFSTLHEALSYANEYEATHQVEGYCGGNEWVDDMGINWAFAKAEHIVHARCTRSYDNYSLIIYEMEITK